MLDVVKASELSAMACGICSRVTSEGRSDCAAAGWKAFTAPETIAAPKITVTIVAGGSSAVVTHSVTAIRNFTA